jgi:protease I
MCLSCGGGEQTEVPTDSEVPQMAKSVLMVIAPKDFRDEEFKEPYDLFTKSGMKVIVASTDTTPAQGMLGMSVKPDITLEQAIPDSFDVLVVVGGSGCEVLWDNTTLHKIVRHFNDQKKTIAAICIAPVVLAHAGILKDMKATAFPAVKDDIGKCGAAYTGADVEVCENIITCSGPSAVKEFSETILSTLKQ